MSNRYEAMGCSPDEALRVAGLYDLDDSDPKPAPKKAKPKSPTARTLDYARKHGWTANVVERWNPHAKVRQDLFGFIDLVVLDGRNGLLAIQATTGPNLGSRVEKINGEPRAVLWLEAGGRIEAWGWRQVNKRKAGARKLWAVRRLKAELVDGAIVWDLAEGEAA